MLIKWVSYENQKMKSSIKDEIGEDISTRQIKEYKNVINIEESLPMTKKLEKTSQEDKLKNTKM